MANVVISDDLRDQLRAAEGPVELTDASGEVVARAVKYIRVCGQLIEDDFPTDEEIDRDLQTGRFKTREQATVWLAELKESARCT